MKIGKYSLDLEQSRAARSKNKATLVVAGAGCGKTTTILGRIKYLIDVGYDPNDVLCISFTNASVDGLKLKIARELGFDIDVFTFHKLAIKVLSQVEYHYRIVSDDFLKYFIDEYFDWIIYSDIKMMKLVLKYFHCFYLNFNVLSSYKQLIIKREFQYFKNNIANFIKTLKANGEKLTYKNKIKKDIFILIALRAYYLYQNELRDNGEFDFDDLIIRASKKVEFSNLGYKHIIIDEFQDTSLVRLELIKKILDKNDGFLYAVGDDFQSIYGFSGCDLNIMLNFCNVFYNSAIYKITRTYRNSNQLIKVAGNFIMKNPLQLRKELTSALSLKSPIICVKYKNIKKDFKKLLDKVGFENGVLVLGRNNYDIFQYIDDEFKVDLPYLYYKNTKIKYMTVHKSKGLESDIVIIINLVNDLVGFPSKLKNDLVYWQNEDRYLYSEERRLFYVALTRTKSYVYLFYPQHNSSFFIREIKKCKEVKKIRI